MTSLRLVGSHSLRLLRNMSSSVTKKAIATKVQDLRSSCSHLQQLCPRFDFDDKTQCNGVRSFLSIVDKYCDLAQKEASEERLEDWQVIGNTLSKVSFLMQQAVKRGDDYHNLTDIDINGLSGSFSSFNKTDVAPIFGSLGPFWLHPDFQRNEGLVTPENAAEVLKRLSVESDRIRAENKEFIKPVIIPRTSSQWVINVADTQTPATVSHVPGRQEADPIHGLLFVPKDNKFPDSLMMHNHGGGFVAMSPSDFVPVLHTWCQELGVTILCIDYAKAPGHKFPSGLQDVLDSYFHVVNGMGKKKIILTGDSAGGNLSSALTFALTSINRQIRENGLQVPEIPLPQSLVLQYPYSSPCWTLLPSILMANMDSFITSPGYATLVPLYVDVDPPVSESRWFRQPEIIPDVMRRFEGRMKDPLFNNPSFTEWQELREVPLHVMVCEFDPLLDQGMALAAKWRTGGAEVRVQVSRGSRHGWLNTPDIPCIRRDFEELTQVLLNFLEVGNKLKSKL